jgi:hypothetical protein
VPHSPLYQSPLALCAGRLPTWKLLLRLVVAAAILTAGGAILGGRGVSRGGVDTATVGTNAGVPRGDQAAVRAALRGAPTQGAPRASFQATLIGSDGRRIALTSAFDTAVSSQ